MSKITDFFAAKKGQVPFSGKKKLDSVTDGNTRVRATSKRSAKSNNQRDIREAFKVIDKCFAASETGSSISTLDASEQPANPVTGTKRKDTIYPVFGPSSPAKRFRTDVGPPGLSFAPAVVASPVRKRILTSHEGSTSASTTSALVDRPKAAVASTDDKGTASAKLSLNAVRERLMGCSKLAELRDCLSRINDCAAKVKDFQEKTKSPVKVPVSPVKDHKRKDDHAKITSPRKFLTDKISSSSPVDQIKYARKDVESGLILPFKYRALLETFRCTDTVVSMLHNRNETCTFAKLKSSVEKMTRKIFDVSKISQILNVYEEAYIVRYEKLMSSMSSDLQMVITPNPPKEKMSPSILLERKQIFSSKLLELVKKAHDQFLRSLSPPVEIDPHSLKRWHPHFKLEDVPDIQTTSSCLPEKPTQSVANTFSSILPKEEDFGIDNSAAEEQSEPSKITNGVLKGISTKLLLKVRAKEAKMIAREMVRNSAEEKKLMMIKQLPELMKIMHNCFISDKKSTLPLETVVRKCVNSCHTTISAHEVQQHLTLISELLPDWLFILKVSRGTFLKIDQDKTLKSLFKRLDDTTALLKRV